MSSAKHIRALLVGTAPSQCEALRPALEHAGFQVIGAIAGDDALEAVVRKLKPDAILIHTDSPARDTLEHLAALHRAFPCPVVVLCEGSDDTAARAAAEMGVSLYVADGISPRSLASSLRTAAHQFRQQEGLRSELREARTELEERRWIDRAKCWLMEREQLREAEAYHRLRRLAMSRGERVASVARSLLSAAGESLI